MRYQVTLLLTTRIKTATRKSLARTLSLQQTLIVKRRLFLRRPWRMCRQRVRRLNLIIETPIYIQESKVSVEWPSKETPLTNTSIKRQMLVSEVMFKCGAALHPIKEEASAPHRPLISIWIRRKWAKTQSQWRIKCIDKMVKVWLQNNRMTH